MALDPNIGRIKFLRSKSAGRLPTTADIDEGELALNLVDRTIYTRNGSNIIDIGFGKGGQVNGNITASGTVKATKLEGPLTGNAATATSLQTARTINDVAFNGTSNIVIADSTKLPLTGGTVTGTIDMNVENASFRFGKNFDIGFVKQMGTGGKMIVGNANNFEIVKSTDASIPATISSAADQSFATLLSLTPTGVLTTPGGFNGNASTATKLQTARTIGGVSFDGTANINLPGVNTTGNQSTTGNAATATKLATARSINGVGFDGTSNITIADSTKLPLTGGTLTGGLTAPNLTATGSIKAITLYATGAGDYSPSGQGAYLSWNRNVGSGKTDFINNRGGGPGGFDWWNGNESSYTQVMSLDQNGVLNAIGGFSGNAASATKLQTARTINGVSFDGTANITIADSTKLPLTGGTISGQLVAPNILINHISKAASGISWYSSSYNNWQDYMAQAGSTGNGVNGNITAPTGTYVTTWARRSVIEPAAGYGWTFETMTMNGTAPSIVAELSTNGTFKTAGDIHGATLTVSGNINATQFSSASPYSFLNGGAAQNIMTGGVLVSNSYADITEVPTNGIYSKGKVQADGGFQGKLLAKDSRVFKPYHAENGGISAYFVTEVGLNNDYTGGNYGDFLSINTYHDSTAGMQNGLFFDKTGKRIVHYQSAFGAGNWGYGKTLAYADEVLSINGGTINGNLNVSDTITVTGVGDHENAFKKLIQGHTTTDGGYIAVGNHGSDKGYVEIGTIDDPDAAIYARKRNSANTILDEAVILGPDGNTSFPRSVNARALGVNSTDGSGVGLSLYGGAVNGLPNYGIAFAHTSNFGEHGYVSSDWATYFTMTGGANRGWIFRSHDYGNVASISSQGNAQFNGNIVTGGNITAFSDRRLKENITPIDNPMDRLEKLNGVTFTRNDLNDTERTYVGLIAQDVLEAMPEAVDIKEDENSTLGVDYQGLVGLLVETIKDLNKRVKELENK